MVLIANSELRMINEAPHSQQGVVVVKLWTSDAVRTGTLYVPKGSWLKDNVSGRSINALIPGHKADLADGACYNDTRVNIAAVEGDE